MLEKYLLKELKFPPVTASLLKSGFYTTSKNSNGAKVKISPPASHVLLKDDFVEALKLRSWKFPSKVIFLGVIAPPLVLLRDNVGKNHD
jgi:hypothetical protein